MSAPLAIRPADVVPGAPATAALTWIVAGAMAFLAVFALALGMAADRLAARWDATLAQTATLRLTAPAAEIAGQTEAALEILRTTPGVAEARLIGADEARALLEPWFGPDIPVEALVLPRLIEIVEGPGGFDPVGLRLRLAGEAPGAVLDDHARWRRPLVQAATGLRRLAVAAVGLIGVATVAMVALAASFALVSNAQTIRVLRLVGARDAYIVRAFTRRFALRALGGALVGTLAGVGLLAALPADPGGVLAGLGPEGGDWAVFLLLPPAAALAAWVTTRIAAFRVLKGEG